MKKLLFLFLAVVSGFLSANAQDDSRLVISAGQFKNISLGENMQVVLISAGAALNEFKSDIRVFEKLSVSISEGTMRITPGRKLGANETVYIIVNELEVLTLGENTKLTTHGILRSSDIKVFVNEGSVAKLRSTGEVSGHSLDNVFISVQKTPIAGKPSASLF
ncbi:MAG TPA: DUF2807 domain-containing protein [Chitinophagaceae bacterium]